MKLILLDIWLEFQDGQLKGREMLHIDANLWDRLEQAQKDLFDRKVVEFVSSNGQQVTCRSHPIDGYTYSVDS